MPTPTPRPRAPRRLPVALLTAAAVLLGALAVPAGAQDDPDAAPSSTSAPSTTSTTAAPTTTAPATTQPSTTQPSTTSTEADGAEPSPTDAASTAGEEGDETTSTLPGDIIDPLVDEEPPDTVPDVDVTVPERDGVDSSGRYAGQGEFSGSEVLFSSVEDARAKLATAEADLAEAVERIRALRIRVKRLNADLDALEGDAEATLVALAEAEAQLEARALNAFRIGTEPRNLALVTDYDELLDDAKQRHLVAAVTEVDQELIDLVIDLRASLEEGIRDKLDRLAVLKASIANAELDIPELENAVEEAVRELEVFEAGSQIYIDNVVFPIQGDYGTPLIDSWGFPRMTGTADEHWHEGIDIFAPEGTPLVAAERGIVTRIGSGRLGGLRLWLRGESGTDWYYAHLAGFAPGLAEGQLVEAGTLIGYVGNTGNAVGTPHHVHLQIHPNGGDPINPYPLLKVISDRELAAAGR